MFYVDGDYEARKGSGIGKGSISLHPGGHSHGPQPGAVERSLGAESFDELAVMVDTFRPLGLGEGGTAVDDGKYAWSWSGRGPGA
jgi:homogentisate 1,2-dioxygenase